MHLNFYFSLLFTLLYVNLTLAFMEPFCVVMKESLGNKPDGIFKKFDAQICKKGCKPTIAHFDSWWKKNAITPVIDDVMKKIGVPQHAKSIHAVADDVVKVVKKVKKDCAKKLGKKHLCQDPGTLNTFGQCLKGHLMPIVMGGIGELMPLVAEPV